MLASSTDDCGGQSLIRTHQPDDCGGQSLIRTNQPDDCGGQSLIRTNQPDDCGGQSPGQTNQMIVGVNLQDKPNTIHLVLAASLLSMQYEKVKAMISWLRLSFSGLLSK